MAKRHSQALLLKMAPFTVSPTLTSEHNKEKFVRRGQFVGNDLALGCSDTLKSDCYISDVEVRPNMSSTLVYVSTEAYEKLVTDTGVENLSSHLNSLALTENPGNKTCPFKTLADRVRRRNKENVKTNFIIFL